MIFRPHRKLRKQAGEWLHLARKVEHYRRDVLPDKDLAALRAARGELEAALAAAPLVPAAVGGACNRLEPHLRRCGGSFYPKSFWAENVETILVAAILAIGIRTFFIQPFKIPTNSMWPTYYGMTAHTYADPAPRPNPLARAFRLVAFGAAHHALQAPAAGELAVSKEVRAVPGRKFLVIRTTKSRYTFFAGGQPVYLDLPPDFVLAPVLDAFFADGAQPVLLPDGSSGLRVPRAARAGEVFLRFDILTGDQLFVDRFTYHFRRPRVGEPFVFRTDDIDHIAPDNRGMYYIKRLAGVPGDTLAIRPPVLYRNGAPADAAAAFQRNADQVDAYPGYSIAGSSAQYPVPVYPGSRPFELPPHRYFALGDNSPHSADSRMWGFVPEPAIVGKALFIYYPFTRRWGRAE
jgi:signal peptidase I